MLRALVSLLVLIVLVPLGLLFIGSRGNLDEDSLFSKIQYNAFDRHFQSDDTITVVTYNLGYLSGMTNNLPLERTQNMFRENLNKVLHVFDSISPDIIGFQEIDFGSSRSFYHNQLDSIALSLEYPVAYRSVNWDKKYVPFPYWPMSAHFGQMCSGQAILSRLDMRNLATEVLIKPINSSFLYDAFYLDRLVQTCDLPLPGMGTIRLMNLHLEAFDQETRVAQAYLVRQLYEDAAAQMPVLMIGDFNSELPAEEPDDAMQVIMEAPHIRSAISLQAYQARPQDFYTFTTGQPYQMIDYILYNSNFIESVDQRVLTELGEVSDHFPVMMKFVVRPQNDRN